MQFITWYVSSTASVTINTFSLLRVNAAQWGVVVSVAWCTVHLAVSDAARLVPFCRTAAFQCLLS